MTRPTSSKSAANRQIRFRFYLMFTFPQTENWLNQQARQGWLLSGVRLHFWFIFVKKPAVNMTYQFDYSGYLVDGYLSQLNAQDWLVYRADRRWNICAHVIKDKPVRLYTAYDADIDQRIGRSIPVVTALSLVLLGFTVYLLVTNDAGYLIALVAVAAVCVGIYNVLRLSLYRMMLQQRISEHETK